MIVVYHVYFSVIYSFIWSVWGWMVIFLIWNQVQVFWAKVYICNFYKSFVVQVLYWAQSSESSRCFENEIHVQITYLYPLLSTLLVQLIYGILICQFYWLKHPLISHLTLVPPDFCKNNAKFMRITGEKKTVIRFFLLVIPVVLG